MATGQQIVLPEEELGSVLSISCMLSKWDSEFVTKILSFQVLFALSGLNGAILWEFGDHVVKSDLMSLYAPQVKVIFLLWVRS